MAFLFFVYTSSTLHPLHHGLAPLTLTIDNMILLASLPQRCVRQDSSAGADYLDVSLEVALVGLLKNNAYVSWSY